MDIYRIQKVCRTYEERASGLIGDPLADGEVCVFVFDTDVASHSFHNKGVIDGTWLSAIKGGVVIDAAYMRADDPLVVSVAPSRVVVESLVEIPVGSGVAISGGRMFVA